MYTLTGAEQERAGAIAPALLSWFDQHGRHDLPWQRDRTSYRVWVSEVMLQQTQVETVIPYYERFIARFPDIEALADASLDEVLHLWAGLGYYARARNLHAAARIIMTSYEGRFPADIDAVQSLPGVGRSTAGAILALSQRQRHAILDGNARRVLARCFAVEGPIDTSAVQHRLWALAEACTPSHGVDAYTQAIMDLGATVCSRTRPGCSRCPFAAHCIAYATDRAANLPYRRPRRTRPTRETWCAIVMSSNHELLLQKRPTDGTWGGLWSFPEFPYASDARSWLASLPGVAAIEPHVLEPRKHAFTHFDLHLHPLLLHLDEAIPPPPDAHYRWLNPQANTRIGLARPVLDFLASTNAVAFKRQREPS